MPKLYVDVPIIYVNVPGLMEPNTLKSIYNYLDYRDFLQCRIKTLKEANPHFTLGSFSKILGLKDTSSINKIIRGQRHPGPHINRALRGYFKFSNNEHRYFNDLIELARVSENSPERIRILERLQKSHPKREFREIGLEEFMCISRWYYPAIRELVGFKNFKEDTQWIAQKLGINAIEVSEALKTMLRLELLVRDETGKILLKEANFKAPNDVKSEAIKRYHEQCLELARKAIRTVDIESRHYLSSTIGIRKKDLPEAKKKIEELLDLFVDVFEDNDPDDLYQINIQLLPLLKGDNDV